MNRSTFFRMLRNLTVCAVLLMGMLACDLSSAMPVVSTPISPWATDASTPQPGAALQEIPMQVGYGARSSFYEVYFTDPFNPDSERDEGGPDVPLVASLDEARLSIDIAAYSMSLRSVRDALLRAQKRGVEVRMVMESDNMQDSVPKALVDAGIPIIGDHRPGLMHDKFMVIDHSEVWTGAMNFTTAGTYEDNNNLIHIRSSKVAEDYTVEFNEMFERDFFGPDAIAATPNRYVTIDGIPLEVYFSPDDKIASRIVELLRGAQQSIHFLAFSFTARDFGDILLQKAKQGLDVSGVMEEEQVKSNKNTEFTPFQEAGLPVYKDGNKGQMHHKVFIIDEKIVIAGSYNFSFSAETQNDENVVIFFDPRIAAQYLAEFKRVDAESQK